MRERFAEAAWFVARRLAWVPLAIGLLAVIGLLSSPRTPPHAAAAAAAPETTPSPPASRAPNWLDDPAAGAKYAEKLALESDGHYERLAPEDRDLLDHMTKGHSQRFLQMVVEYHRKKKTAAQGKPHRPEDANPGTGEKSQPDAKPTAERR